jgi:hypothetical protein
MVQIVEENHQMVTPRQIMQAKEARDLYEMVGRPSYNDFIAIIRNNLLLNSKIIPYDVLHAEAIFGKDLGGILGKTTRKHPDRVITDYIHVPDDMMKYHKKVVLAIDIMMIAEMPFLITTSIYNRLKIELQIYTIVSPGNHKGGKSIQEKRFLY